MASPLLSTFCCEFNYDHNESDSGYLEPPSYMRSPMLSYNILCIISSVIGIGGAIYQLLARLRMHRSRSSDLPVVIERQSNVILWLAMADGLASLGILIRSLVWIPTHWQHDKFDILFCAISSGWIQYFYICTYLWTFVFAIDMYMNASDHEKCAMWVNHVICWGIPLILSIGSLTNLYYPNLYCCGNSGSNDLGKKLPHYLSTYIPMIGVMIVNPILFYCSSNLVKKDLHNRGTAVEEQNKIVSEVIRRFFTFILIFYVCWLPNLINGVLLLILRQDRLKPDEPLSYGECLALQVFIAIWQVMAILNPIQAFLNSLVYGSIAIWPQRHPTPQIQPAAADTSSRIDAQEHYSSISGEEENADNSPLLLFRWFYFQNSLKLDSSKQVSNFVNHYQRAWLFIMLLWKTVLLILWSSSSSDFWKTVINIMFVVFTDNKIILKKNLIKNWKQNSCWLVKVLLLETFRGGVNFLGFILIQLVELLLIFLLKFISLFCLFIFLCWQTYLFILKFTIQQHANNLIVCLCVYFVLYFDQFIVHNYMNLIFFGRVKILFCTLSLNYCFTVM